MIEASDQPGKRPAGVRQVDFQVRHVRAYVNSTAIHDGLVHRRA
jgi:hypothetical protein